MADDGGRETPGDRGPRAATLLHTSDCHLSYEGSPEGEAFAAMVDLAIRAEVDAVLVTGDLFDHNRVVDSVLDWTGEQIDRLPCPVVLLVGNHDELDPATSVHRRFDAGHRCRQVTFLDDHLGALVEIPGTDMVVWGRAMVAHEPGFRPLVGVPARPEGRWCVVAGHGLVMDTETPNGRSSPIYPSDLAAVDWDYVALGHCHAHREVRGGDRPAYYAGATFASKGQVPGAVLVDFVPGVGARPRWCGLAAEG